MPLVRVERRGRCAWVTLDRPPLNLFTLELIAAVRETFDTLARDAGVGAAVLTGSGRAFTAGQQGPGLPGPPPPPPQGPLSPPPQGHPPPPQGPPPPHPHVNHARLRPAL